MSHRRRSIEAGLYPVTKSVGKKEERRTTMAIVLPDTVTRLLDGRNFAYLATIMSDGSPHCAPVWVGREGDRIIICTMRIRSKARIRGAIRGWPSPSLIWTIPIARRSFAGG